MHKRDSNERSRARTVINDGVLEFWTCLGLFSRSHPSIEWVQTQHCTRRTFYIKETHFYNVS